MRRLLGVLNDQDRRASGNSALYDMTGHQKYLSYLGDGIAIYPQIKDATEF
jgi:hypothetical protein